MRTNQRSCVIIVREGKILFIKRNKGGDVYYVLPGGGVESDETPDQAAIREAKEELGIDVEIDKEVSTFENRGNTEHYYSVRDYEGKIKFLGDSHLSADVTDEEAWIGVHEIEGTRILPERIKDVLSHLLISSIEKH